ncbi:hypothetical protein MMC22_010203 [Lobaria immixta]|nr:hypothetical protein [Lobaria immixta]
MEITSFIIAQRDKALLVGDYGSYRKQLSRRLLTVRRKLNHISSKGHKYAAIGPITAEEIASNHEFVHLFLLSSERAWATAMHMKSHHAADSGINGITGSTRRHIGSRLHRASIYAGNLVDRLKEKEVSGASSQDIQEARAYYVSMRGNIEFEKQNWEKCLREYSEARLIYAALARSGRSKKDDLFRDLTSTTIEPSIRYAAYQLKLPRTTSIDKIVARYVPRNTEYVDEILKLHPDALDQGTAGKKKGPGELSQDLPSTITWRSRTVSLEDAAIAQALATVSAAETKLSSLLSSDPNLDPRAKAAAYDEVLIPSQDAVDATKTAIDELTADGIPQGDRRMQALQITRTAVNYALVGWRIGRNRILCGDQDGAILEARALRKPKKPRKDGKERKTQDESRGQKLIRLRERVVLYDATLQSLDSVKELPGVAADQAFLKELDGKRAYFATLRCLVIARSHALLSKTKNALALFARALDLVSSITNLPSQQATEKPPNLEITQSQVSNLQKLLQTLVAHHRALAELESLTTAAASVPKPPNPAPLVERLDEYPALGSGGVDLLNLVTYPPRVEAVPVKPLFLDVAWNYIEYPGRAKNRDPVDGGAGVNGVRAGAGVGDGRTEEKKEGRKGWFGFGR